MATTTYSDMEAAATLHDEDVFAIDQPSGNVSRKTRLDQVAGYVGNKAVTPAVNAEATRAIGSEGAILLELTQEASRAQSAEDTIADAADAAQSSANAANAALPGKANIIPGSHIDWNFHTTPVPAGRTLLFDTSKTPSLSGGSIPTTAAFIIIDSDPNKMFGFFTDDDGATTLGGLFHIDGDEFVLDRPVWDGTSWVDNGRYVLQYGINPGPMDYIGDSTLNGFDMLADITVQDIPARDLVDVENELKDSLSDDISENNRHRTFTTRATKELLANMSSGFLVRARIDPFDWSVKPYSEWNARTVDPQYVVEAEADLPGTSTAGDIAITSTGDIYTSDGTDWTKQNSATNTLIDGWLFAETTTKKGWYAFGGEWEQLDFSIDWTEIVDGTSVGYDGEHIYVKGYAEILSGIAGKVDKQQSVADAGKSLMVDEDGKVILDFAGSVDSVNGIIPDSSKNVQTDYVFDTEADFEAAKASIPVGATVIKLYEYPENFAGFMAVPDYAQRKVLTGMVDTGDTWTADRDGFVHLSICNQVIDNARFNINGVDVLNVTGTNDWEREEILCEISKGDVLSISGRAAHPAHDGQYVVYKAYFFPVKYVVTKNAVTVLNKLTPHAGRFIGQPDYAATETINRITASGGTWTVEHDGYVRCSGVATGSSQIGLQIYINGQRITGSYVYPVAQFDNVVIHPVSKGDVVLINVIGTMTSIGCYFIPPKTVPNLFVEGADLQSSGDVGKVAIDPVTKTMTVSGEIDTTGLYSLNRPDLWPDGIELNFGNNLYGMRKEGTISVTAGGSTQVGFGASATKFIDGNGEYQRGTDTVWHSVNGTVPSGFTSMLFRQGNIRWALNCDYAITDAPYNVWVTYKK